MSTSRQSITVSRDYKAAPDECVRALEILLKQLVKKGAEPGAPDNAEDFDNGRIANASIIPEQS